MDDGSDDGAVMTDYNIIRDTRVDWLDDHTVILRVWFDNNMGMQANINLIVPRYHLEDLRNALNEEIAIDKPWREVLEKVEE